MKHWYQQGKTIVTDDVAYVPIICASFDKIWIM